jgi:hypothetical protein
LGVFDVFTVRKLALVPALAMVVLAMTACGAEKSGTGESGRSGESSGRPERSESIASESASKPPSPAPERSQHGEVIISVTIDGQQFQATLADSAAARDLAAQLPVTIDMRDHGGVEKTGPLPLSLSLDGQPDGADPDVGDVGYYAPSNDFVLYYGDQSYYEGIVVLGRLSDGAAPQLSELRGSVTAVIKIVED